MIPTLSHTLLLAAALLASSLALAETLTGSGRPATEPRAVSGFNSVSLAVPGRLEVTQGNSESLTLTADDNVLPWIETVVEDGMLKIRFRKPPPGQSLNVNRVKISAVLSARQMEAMAVAGSGDIASGPIKSTRFVANIAGSGNMDLASVDAEDVSVRIGGSGDLTVRGGRTDTLDLRIGGSGEMKAAKLESKRAKIKIGGSGDATLWARETLSVRVGGSGSIRYYGDPKVDRSIAGSGDVQRAGASPT